jgi:predicted ABC-type ATPase
MTDAELDPPTDRTCERCGRRDTWDEAAATWRIVVEDGDKVVGDPYCIHEWDVTAEHNPFRGA